MSVGPIANALPRALQGAEAQSPSSKPSSQQSSNGLSGMFQDRLEAAARPPGLTYSAPVARPADAQQVAKRVNDAMGDGPGSAARNQSGFVAAARETWSQRLRRLFAKRVTKKTTQTVRKGRASSRAERDADDSDKARR